MYDARTISGFFEGKLKEVNRPIVNASLQSFLFFANGWFLVLFGTNLLKNKICLVAQRPIFWIDHETAFTDPSDLESSTVLFLSKIWDVYSKFSDSQLCDLALKDAEGIQSELNYGINVQQKLLDIFKVKRQNGKSKSDPPGSQKN